jgi:hypothetical protein
MDEIVLIIAALALLGLPKLLLNKVKHPYNSYIKFLSALVLLLLVWLSDSWGGNNLIVFRVFMTVLVVYGFYKNFISFRKQNAEPVN